MRSLDGIHWKHEEGLPYDASTTFYTDGTKNKWYKFERPKVLLDDIGRVTHMALAVMDVAKGADKGNDNHSSKNLVIPLVTEKLVSIVGTKPINASTRTVNVLVEAEDGFDPTKDLKLESLRFGSDSVVKYGGGCRVVNSKPKGRDLLLEFEGNTGFRGSDFDFKLIGETGNGDLIIGYALLPDRSPVAAALIALPVKVKDEDGKRTLESTVENWGIESSGPVEVSVWQHTRTGVEMLKTVNLPPVASYGDAKVTVDLGNPPKGPVEYELVLSEKSRRVARWNRVDDTNRAVTFEGEWEQNGSAKDCFLETEHRSRTMGDAVTFTFTGHRAIVHGKIGRGLGSFDVFIDDEFIEKVRCNWGGVYNAPIYQTGLLKEGEHTLKLVKSKSEFSGECTIDWFGYRAGE